MTVFFPNKIWSRKTPVREIIPVMTILNATPILAECLRIKPPCYINYADVFALFNVFQGNLQEKSVKSYEKHIYRNLIMH